MVLIKKNGIVKHKTNLAKIRKHFQNTAGGGDADKWFKIPEPQRGQAMVCKVRILPPWNDKGFFYYAGGLHYKFSIGGRPRAIPCPEVTEDEQHLGKCPICQFVARMRNSNNPKKFIALVQGWGTNISVQRQYWVNVIDRADPGTIKIWGTNGRVIQEIIDAGNDPDVGDITDAETGYDFIITRRGKGGKTRYTYRVAKKATPVKFKQSQLHMLDTEVLEWMTYEQMLEVLKNNYEDEMREVGFKFPKKEKKAKLKVVKKKKKHVEVEDDEDIEIEDEDEVEIEEDDDGDVEQEDQEDDEDSEDEEDNEEDDEDEE